MPGRRIPEGTTSLTHSGLEISSVGVQNKQSKTDTLLYDVGLYVKRLRPDPNDDK